MTFASDPFLDDDEAYAFGDLTELRCAAHQLIALTLGAYAVIAAVTVAATHKLVRRFIQ